MRRIPRNLADVREELVQLQEEFTRLQKRIEAVRDCVTDSLVRFLASSVQRLLHWLKRNSLRDIYPVCSTETDMVAMVNPAQTSGSQGTKNVIALKAAIQALKCKRMSSRGK